MTRDPAEAMILVVDDYADLRSGLLRALLQAGYARAYAVASAREAIELLENGPLDLVVMDVSLDREDAFRHGCAAVMEIVTRWPATRCVLMTGWGAQDLPADCPRGLPLIQKPIGPQPFLARVADLLNRPPWRPRPEA